MGRDVPVALVKTWVEIYLDIQNDEVKKHVENMISINFGSLKKAIDYIEDKEGIRLIND